MLDQTASFRTQHTHGGGVANDPPSIMFTASRRLRVSGDSGFVTTRLRTIEGTDVVIGSVRSTGHAIELREMDRLTILMPREGRLRVRVGASDYGVTPDSPMAFRPGQRATEAIASRSGIFAATTLQIPTARIRALAEAAQLPLHSVLELDAQALRGRIDAAVLKSMLCLADDIFLQPEAPLPPKVAAAIAEVIDEQLLAMLDSLRAGTTPRVLPAFHRVRAAEEIMHAHRDEPLSMIDLAQEMGISLHSLQLAFRDVHDGKSPRQVYTRMRLEQARRKLLEASGIDQVTTIALDAGFLHLSRFAHTYAQTFGELPSETLSRRRRA